MNRVLLPWMFDCHTRCNRHETRSSRGPIQSAEGPIRDVGVLSDWAGQLQEWHPWIPRTMHLSSAATGISNPCSPLSNSPSGHNVSLLQPLSEGLPKRLHSCPEGCSSISNSSSFGTRETSDGSHIHPYPHAVKLQKLGAGSNWAHGNRMAHRQ